MGKLAVGTVVLAHFPYSDFQRYKKRPALIIGLAEFGDVILCQITSSKTASHRAIKLVRSGFAEGGLPTTSYVRPDKIFTVDQSIVERRLGRLTDGLREQILGQIRQLFTAG
ncbi:MAG: type II toxin-antitoxin system PemK/MazF family toxin [Patescibacteria group bacterium]